MNTAISPGFGDKGMPHLPRCVHCPSRLHAPCGAIQGVTAMVDLERAHAPLRRVPSGGSLFEQGSVSDRSYTILRGWVALTRVSNDGRLSILRFVLPGDVLEFERQSSINTVGAVAVGDAIVCSLSRSRQERLEHENPSFDVRHRAVQAETLAQAYDTLASTLGHSARERVGHLLYQLAWRAQRRRPMAGDQVDAPLSQIQIGLATGLTAVHVSRTMRQLREDGAADIENHRLTIRDPAALARSAGDSPEIAALWA